jgi:hypothetical protein
MASSNELIPQYIHTSFGLGRTLQVQMPHLHMPNPEHTADMLFIWQAFSFT